MAGKKGMHKNTYARPQALERIRERIKNSQIADRVIKHALGEIEMTTTQVRAAEILLRKVMPDLASTELTDNRQSWVEALKSLAKQKDAKPVVQDQPEEDRPSVH